jgi:hypothetical protein
VVARGPGAVGCAHCRTIGATVDCRVCGHLVCPACAADWTTCEAPSGRVIRLGTTARLRDVDPTGRLGLVSRWRGAMRLLDLRRMCWVNGPELPGYYRPGVMTQVVPRLTGRGHLLHPVWVTGVEANSLVLAGLAATSVLTGEKAELETGPASHGGMVSATGDRYWFIGESERIEIVQLATMPGTAGAVSLGPIEAWRVDRYEPMPGKVMQSAFVDAERELIAVGTWGGVGLYRINEGRHPPLGRAEAPGDVRWIALGGHRLAAIVGGRAAITVWRLKDDLTIGGVMYHHSCASRVRAASLSRDGRYLALGLADDSVELHALDTATVTRFTEHTDRICLVAFAGDDHLLVTADNDNRVVLRPRVADGYARVAMPVALSAETIEIAEVLGR